MTAPVWIDETDALALHDRLLALHGGAAGVREPGLLASALARARNLAAYDDAADVIAMAVATRPESSKTIRSSTATSEPASSSASCFWS